ncbi:HNH/ENDO VII family nuclease [Candidatus Odyssella thessalonicensis]|uniref:HNH/ENDO VII family nuclease n=1 Tax=Candidatus Odyssella thessalonicensis TaxID=84647 RepID=UPI003CCA7371
MPVSLTPTSARILHHAKWVEALETTAPQTHAEHTAVFLDSLVPGAYHSPIKVGTNTYYLLKGISPKGTPRRKENLTKLRKGKAPLLVNLKTGQPIPYEMHHVGQKNRKSSIVMLPVELHKERSKQFHTYTGPSDIDRNGFNSEKRRVFKRLAEKFEKLEKGDQQMVGPAGLEPATTPL